MGKLMPEGSMAAKGAEDMGTASNARLCMRIFNPLLVGFWVGLRLTWPLERAAENIRTTRKESIWKPWTALPLKSLGTHSPRSWVQVPKRMCTCTSSFPPAVRWPSKSAGERSTCARRQDSVPKRTSWARSHHTLTFFRCMKAESPPQATAIPCSNTLREAITRPSWNPTVSAQTRCSPSASIWQAPFSRRTAKASSTATSSPAIFLSTRMACPCFPISASRERFTGAPASATPSRGLRRKCLRRTAEATNPLTSILWGRRCSPC